MPTWSFPRADGLPPYAFVITDAVKARVIAAGADLIDLGLGNPDQPAPPQIVEVMQRAADVGRNHRYHPGRGLLDLRVELARWYERRYRVRFDPEAEVCVTLGAKEGIGHLCFAVLDRGDLALSPDPCYPIHASGPRIAGADVVHYAAASDLAPADAVSEALEREARAGRRVKLVIANYPHNPSGRVVSREELAALVRVVQRSGAVLLHDLAYADLDFESRFAPSVFDCGVPPGEVKEFAVETFSMSKSYCMPGWRLAFMVGSPRVVGALSHMKSYLDYGTFIPLQVAAAWALEHGDALVERLRALYQLRARTLATALTDAGWPDIETPKGTMFIWAKIPPELSTEGSLHAATRLMEEAQVAVSPGITFGSGGDGHVRFALIEDPPRLAEACARMAPLLRGERGPRLTR